MVDASGTFTLSVLWRVPIYFRYVGGTWIINVGFVRWKLLLVDRQPVLRVPVSRCSRKRNCDRHAHSEEQVVGQERGLLIPSGDRLPSTPSPMEG